MIYAFIARNQKGMTNATFSHDTHLLIDRLDYHIFELPDKDAVCSCMMKLFDIIEEPSTTSPIVRAALNSRKQTTALTTWRQY